jgi:hypothetical protein
VRFEDKECSEHPDLDSVERPPLSRLNVNSSVELDGCWPVGRATRGPVRDGNCAQMLKHLKRSRGMNGMKFKSFDMKDGKCIFTGEHF